MGRAVRAASAVSSGTVSAAGFLPASISAVDVMGAWPVFFKLAVEKSPKIIHAKAPSRRIVELRATHGKWEAGRTGR